MSGHGVRTAYLAAGANRQTAAADWGDDGTLCYGAGVNLAVWRPTDAPNGVLDLLGGHRDVVKAVQFLAGDDERGESYFVSGGDDQSLKLWAIPGSQRGDGATAAARCVQTVEAAHAAPINYVAAPKAAKQGSLHQQQQRRRRIFASGGADYAIKIWALERREGEEGGEAYQIVLLQTIKTSPRYFPLCLALVSLDYASDGPTAAAPAWLLAAAGTNNRIQIFVGTETPEAGGGGVAFALQASLTGHEGWVRSLDFGWESRPAGAAAGNSDLLLASASQDKYVRLWRIHKGAGIPAPSAAAVTASGAPAGAADNLSDFLPGKSPSNKAHVVRAGDADYTITFEALLLGHEDWIYSAKWAAGGGGAGESVTGGGSLRLLTASADNSLAVWEADAASGIWVTTARLGELSKEKGATTATGSVGGFWTGLWSPSGRSVATLCRTGSWRRWDFDAAQARWVQAVGVAGHVAPVAGVAWSRDGAYLLSTGGDQTTRLHAEWTTADSSSSSSASWHEMARPQIHGYDLNCIDSLGASQFVSGADEKLMRVFREPKTVARLLARLTGANAAGAAASIDALPDAANMPVLGLSNKAVDADGDGDGVGDAAGGNEAGAPPEQQQLEVAADDHPPFEDVLARSTLWPETEKLYGHGYEISCLAVSHDGRLVASACRASSLNHAVVRLFETARWTEVRPPLAAHALTVTRLRFSADDRFLLSVGRDRQWAVFERQARGGEEEEEEEEAGRAPSPTYGLRQANGKAHTRMILDCAWAPLLGSDGAGKQSVFATAGRDKNVKVWSATTGTPAVAAAAAAGDTTIAAAAPTFALATTIPQEHPVTAVDFLWRPAKGSDGSAQQLILAVGTEGGRLSVVSLDAGSLAVSSVLALDAGLCLPKAVLQLAWRPSRAGAAAATDEIEADTGVDLAIAGEDASLRVYRFQGI